MSDDRRHGQDRFGQNRYVQDRYVQDRPRDEDPRRSSYGREVRARDPEVQPPHTLGSRARDPMGRSYDPYRGYDERGRTGGGTIPDESGYDRNTGRRGAADPGYRPDEQRRRDHATDQFRPRDDGHLGDWDWRRARRGEVEGDYGRGYGNRENDTYRRDDQYADRDRREAPPRPSPRTDAEAWASLRRDRFRPGS